LSRSLSSPDPGVAECVDMFAPTRGPTAALIIRQVPAKVVEAVSVR
jgi:hypothetical protein